MIATIVAHYFKFYNGRVSMKKINTVVILFFLIGMSPFLHANSLYDISVEASADGYCAGNKKINEKCFRLNEA